MIRYVLKRVLVMIPILIAVAILIFALMYVVPGDPSVILIGENPTPEQIAQMNAVYGFDDPFLVQLGRYLYNLFFKGSFGRSYIYGLDVGKAILERFPRTLILAVGSVIVSIVVGVSLGVFSAMHANRLGDRVTLFVSMLLHSMPEFWLALLLVLLFSLKLGWLPATGAASWKNYVLPIVANSTVSLANIMRQTRSSMLDVIRADYVSTARSKGLKERAVIWGHALPNALIPVVTVIGSRFGHLLGGTAVIETIFVLPGIGSYMVNGLGSQDYPVVQGTVVYIAFTFSIIMLVTDVLYAFIDPRIKAKYIKQKRKKAAEAKAPAMGG